MPYIIESSEWRLLRTLGMLLNLRLGHYRTCDPQSFRSQSDFVAVNPNAELLEVELRRVFMLEEHSLNLKADDFDSCQIKLTEICSLLNGLSYPRIAGDDCRSQDLNYLQLRNLIDNFQKRQPGTVDIIYGSNPTVFRLPGDGELSKCLEVITNANKDLSYFLERSPQEQPILPIQGTHKQVSWKKSRIRERATCVLERIFQRFSCNTSHEVLFKLVQDLDENSALPDLTLILSPCPELVSWQEILCSSVDLGINSITLIPDLCGYLRQTQCKRQQLMLLAERDNLFGTWSGISTSDMVDSRQSLEELILKGAFKPLDLSIFKGDSPATFTLQDKRTLAVKLGYCLMDFFDVDVTSNRIHFLDSSTPTLKKESVFLAFSARLPESTEAYYNFEVGHPVLLSFAKLLLEVHFGQNIDLNISSRNSENHKVWLDLLTKVDLLAQERSDTYFEAIQACLVVHKRISKTIRSRRVDSPNAAVPIIRKKLYKDVVRKLERGLEELIPRPIHKRQRSESPPRDRHRSPGDKAKQEKESRNMMATHSTWQYKRQRVQKSSHRQLSPTRLMKICEEETQEPTEITNFKDYPKFDVSRRMSQQPSLFDSTRSSSARMGCSSSDVPPEQNPRREEFEIAIICALSLEYNAVSYLFDEFWDDLGSQTGQAPGDPNSYTAGRMCGFKVVLALLPEMGKVNAASAAASMRSTYRNLRLAVLVGICGASPYHEEREIILGDVILSSIVIQHDFGRQYPDKFIRKNTKDSNLRRPNKEIRNLLALLKTDRGNSRLEQRIATILQELREKIGHTRYKGRYDYPGAGNDKLFKSTYRHKHRKLSHCECCIGDTDSNVACNDALTSSCIELGCDESYIIARDRLQAIRLHSERIERTNGEIVWPAVHIGTVASGDTVLKSAVHRDTLARESGVIAFEMEGAGIWDDFPSIVVKGVCDYADSHKNKDWQNFAAATAASACKAILERYPRLDNA